MKINVLVLFGPTASGKTELLEQLCEGGNRKKIEIISADSMQVYRGMDIGTAKPSLKERKRIPHHLIDIRNPDEQFNAGEFVRLAEEACLAAASRGAIPVVSGGTGFYLKNLVQGISGAPPSDSEIRRELKEELDRAGVQTLMEELAKADPVSSTRIHINDTYRLLRALEVYRLTGRPLSSFSSPWNPAENTPIRGDYCFRLIGLRRSREDIYSRINARTAEMFRSGLEREVRRLFEAGYTPRDPGLRAIGYREFFVEDTPLNVNPETAVSAANGRKGSIYRISGDLGGVEALVAQNSRRYAKRQITFFASIPGVTWLDCGDDTARDIQQELKDFW